MTFLYVKEVFVVCMCVSFNKSLVNDGEGIVKIKTEKKTIIVFFVILVCFFFLICLRLHFHTHNARVPIV